MTALAIPEEYHMERGSKETNTNFFQILSSWKKKPQKQRESRIQKSDYDKLLYSCTCIDVHKSVDLGGKLCAHPHKCGY